MFGTQQNQTLRKLRRGRCTEPERHDMMLDQLNVMNLYRLVQMMRLRRIFICVFIVVVVDLGYLGRTRICAVVKCPHADQDGHHNITPS